MTTQQQPLRKLYYWPARGRGEQIRIILSDAGMPFEDVTWDASKGEAAKQEFFKMCKGLGGHTTTNIPMLEEGGKFYTQSSAIIRKIGRDAKLYTGTYEEDMLIATVEDLRSANYKAMSMFGATDKAIKSYIDVVLPKHLRNLERLLLSTEGLYLLGNDACVADLTLYDALHVAERQVPGVLSKYPRVKLFFDTVEGRPGVKKWVASDQRKKLMAFPSVVKTTPQKVDGDSRCPWPFIYFHDPATGLRDWQTWLVAGLATAWYFTARSR